MVLIVTQWNSPPRRENINTADLEDSLRQSPLFVCPSTDIAKLLDTVVFTELDTHASRKTYYQRPSKPKTNRLSRDAKTTKRERRRL